MLGLGKSLATTPQALSSLTAGVKEFLWLVVVSSEGGYHVDSVPNDFDRIAIEIYDI